MKAKKSWSVFWLVALALALLLVGGVSYQASVQNALWNQSVADTLEVTAQGGHALDTYLEKDAETLHWMAQHLATMDAADGDALAALLQSTATSESTYVCVDLNAALLYSPAHTVGYALDADELAVFRGFAGAGVREPYLDGHTGVRMLGEYECFTFADGAPGVVQRARPLAEVAQRFSLSFYGDEGFSYVVDQAGEILVRSQHRNSNRTMQNLFDIIDLQGNDAQVVQSFRQALAAGQQGVARFRYQGAEYVFCYVPLANAPGWDVVSIIPNQVIMEQASTIVQNSQLFLMLILFSVVVLAAFFLLYRNATRRVLQAEEAARHAAEQANVAKSQFLSNMSHDIRTPMNAIIGMTNLAQDHLHEPEKLRGYLKNISQSGQLLVSLINDILDLSKIESGKMQLNNAPTSLDQLLGRVVSLIQASAGERDQQFTLERHTQTGYINVDALRLNQVLINLLSNAVKFTPKGGRVTLTVTESPSPKPGCTHLTFTVADNGVGMQPEFLEHIFDSFVREQDSRTSQIEGSGLGLAIVKMIVDQMQGSIAVQSAPGLGSTFTVELDVAPAAAPPQPEPQPDRAAPAAPADLAGRRILLAEDNLLNRKIVVELLGKYGLQVEAVENGQLCLEHFAASAPGTYDMILMDVQMPVMNGYEATRRIRALARPDAAAIPIFAMTADAFTEDIQAAKQAGMNAHISKPIDTALLLREMTRFLENKP